MTALETFTTASKPPLTTGRRPDMAAICAFEPFEATSRADVKHPLRIAALDASIGRKARLQRPPRERPQSAPKPTFYCDREIGFTALCNMR